VSHRANGHASGSARRRDVRHRRSEWCQRLDEAPELALGNIVDAKCPDGIVETVSARDAEQRQDERIGLPPHAIERTARRDSLDDRDQTLAA
jgi:hypothetical protein